jgi:hypothetical protein
VLVVGDSRNPRKADQAPAVLDSSQVDHFRQLVCAGLSDCAIVIRRSVKMIQGQSMSELWKDSEGVTSFNIPIYLRTAC